MVGRLEVIMGCMFSGKTSEMIRRIKRFRAIGKKVFVVNSAKDIRCDESLHTHDSVNLKAVKVDRLHTIMDKIVNYDIIAIDEFQFFDEHAIDVVKTLVYLNKEVIVAGLDGDFKQKKFGCVIDLIPFSDDVTKLSALCCHCGLPAPFTKRTTHEISQELVGASEYYIPVCRNHL